MQTFINVFKWNPKIMRGIINTRTKKHVLCTYRLCDSVFAKARGLMFSWKKPDFGLVFAFKRPVRTPLHMLFVFYPIDVLFLDKQRRIVEIKRGFMPFTIYSPLCRANYIVETVAGKTKGCKVGDILAF